MSALKVHASSRDTEPMVHPDDLRASFVLRLKKALSLAGIPEWGAGARLAKIANVTPKASSKWLNGETMPGRSKMLAIAAELRVRLEWLEYGDGEMRDGTVEASNVAPTEQPDRSYLYPVVSEVAAGAWREATQAYEPGAEDDLVTADYKAKGPAFWLRVTGDSMTWTGKPSIPEGFLILVDTGMPEKNGDLVVAKRESENEATFKKLVIEGGTRYLKPLNPSYETLPLGEGGVIIGVVKEVKLKL